jgi:Acyl-CoA dehydrogenase, C-terminal domain
VEADDLQLLTETLRKTMLAGSGYKLAEALSELGWQDMLEEMPDTAIPLVFRLLGETGAHAPVLNDVVFEPGGTGPLPYAGGSWIVWDRTDERGTSVDDELPIRRVDRGDNVPMAAGRRALGWWLVGSSRTMLSLAREHALSRTQFGKPVASFQVIRHRLAETLVAIEGAEATLGAATDDFTSLLAKAAAGRAAAIAAKHCQQVLGGIGFTAEHELHRHVKRTLVLDGLLGNARELTREAGAVIRTRGCALRLVDL